MREVIANQMLTLSEGVDNEESCDLNSRPEVQESVTQNSSFLGVGDPFCRGNPHKRWLAIEREEKAMMQKMQEQASKYSQDRQREEGRNVRYSQSDADRRTSHRDYREEDRRHDKSGEYDRDSREHKSWLRNDRRENRVKTDVKDPEKYRQSRCDDSKKYRNDHWNHESKNEKRENSVKIAKHESKKFQASSKHDRREDFELEKLGESHNVSKASTVERKRKYEEKESFSDQAEKCHKKKKKKKKHKRKHEKKSRRSSSSS
jgi:hypothetical protein